MVEAAGRPLDAELALDRHRPAHAILAEALRRRIMLGGFAPGTKLPTEREVALGLGVSRNTVRQALRVLAADGLISTSRGRTGGSVVQLPTIAPRSRRRIAAAWRQEIDDGYQFRLTLEPLAARWAAERSTARQRAELARLTRQKSQDLAGYHQLDTRFHLLVAEMARHDLLRQSVARAREDMLRRVNALWMSFGMDVNSTGFDRDHRAIAQAIGDRRPETAAAAMVAHLRRAREQFASLLDRILAHR
jgi:GntR family transcriptional regulator, transcriptional repressor for pyruvate dehydrogenase complex